jgi:GTP-binding protein
MELMTTDADGRTRMEFLIPTRGLVGYRGQLLTETRGTALLHQIGAGYGPWAGEVSHRTSGVLVSDRSGESNAYGALQPAGAGDAVHRGRRRGLRGHDRRRELAAHATWTSTRPRRRS